MRTDTSIFFYGKPVMHFLMGESRGIMIANEGANWATAPIMIYALDIDDARLARAVEAFNEALRDGATPVQELAPDAHAITAE